MSEKSKPLPAAVTDPAVSGVQPNQEAVTHAVEALAGEFHEEWRRSRKDEDGGFESRVKSTIDEAWIAQHETDQVDIANTPFEDLPSDWQAENRAAAEVVVGVMAEHNGRVDLTNPAVLSDVGGKVHDAWLSRNQWAAGGELDVPFVQLPEDEQAKDLNQVAIAQRLFAS